MDNFLDKLYDVFGIAIIILGVVAYFFYNTMQFQGGIQRAMVDPHTWIHAIFVTVLQVLTVSVGSDKGFSKGISSAEFIDADDENNDIINEVNGQLTEFRTFNTKLSKHNQQIVQDDYRYNKYNDKPDSELTKRQLKKLHNLSYLKYDISGFNLPLYYTKGRGGSVKTDASYDLDRNKLWAMVKKIGMALITVGLTFNMSFVTQNLGNAFFSLLILIANLTMVYLFYFFKPYTQLSRILPQKVKVKKNLFQSYKENEHNFSLEQEPTVDLDYEPKEIELHIRKEKED